MNNIDSLYHLIYLAPQPRRRSNMCLTCSALSWRGLCARLKRVLSTNRDNSAVRSKHVFCVCADSLYRSRSQDGESDSSYLISYLISFFFSFSFFSSTLHYLSFIFILFLIFQLPFIYLLLISTSLFYTQFLSLFLFNTPLFI